MSELLEVPRTARQVKEAFVLANCLKNGPFDASWRAAIVQHRSAVAAMSDEALNDIIGTQDPLRLRQMNESSWRYGLIELANCTVYPQMGGHPSVMGNISTVAPFFEKHVPKTDRIWTMAERRTFTFHDLPLIVHRRTAPGHYRIDDGNHRAVAYFLSGMRRAYSFIGSVPSGLGHTW